MKKGSALRKIFNILTMEKKTTKEFKRLSRIFYDQKDKFKDCLAKNHQETLEEVIDSCIDMEGQEVEEYYALGFKQGAKLMIEIYQNEEGCEDEEE